MSEQEQGETPQESTGARPDRGALWRLAYVLVGLAVVALVFYLVSGTSDEETTPDPNFAAAKQFKPEAQYDGTTIDPAKLEVCRLVSSPVATALRLKRQPGTGGLSCTWTYADFDPRTSYRLQAKVEPSTGLPAGTRAKIGKHQVVRSKAAGGCTIAFGLADRARIDMTVTGGPESCERVEVTGAYLENFLPLYKGKK